MIRSLDQMSRDIQGLRSDIQEMEFKVQVVSMPTIIGAAEGRSSDSSSKQIRASNPQVVRITNNSNKDSRSQDDN